MTDRTPDDSASDDREPAREPSVTPGFLSVFEDLRRRPPRSLQRRIRGFESRVARRRPAPKGRLQRGDVAEPPPVLDLVLDRSEDRDEVQRMLVENCSVNPVWRLPRHWSDEPGEADPGKDESEDGDASPRPSAAGRVIGDRARRWHRWARPVAETVPQPLARPRFETGDSDSEVTTDELYDLIESMMNGGFAWMADPPEPPRGYKPPPPPRFSRLRSLLWLRRCDHRQIRQNDTGAEYTPEHGTLKNSSHAQVTVINGLREVRLDNAVRYRDELLDRADRAARDPEGPESPRRWEILHARYMVYWRRLARRASTISRWVTKASGKATFGLLDEKILTPMAFVVSLFVAAAPFTFAYVGLAAQQVNELVSVLVGLLLVTVYGLTVFFFFLPWRTYLWLNRHRYLMDEEGQDGSLHARDEGFLGRHRARGVHLLNQLNNPRRNKGRIGDADQPRSTRPPGTHQIAVNALLDDLDRAYGAARWRRKSRRARPVLIYDQRRLDRVGRYFVRLIEDERLRRAFPDPLLLVQVRSSDEEPLLDGVYDVSRHGRLPELSGAPRATPAVRDWTRGRYLAGALGAVRTLSRRVPPLSEDVRAQSWRTQGTWVMTRPVRAGVLVGSGAVTTALLVLVGLVFVPAQVQALRPCVEEGVREPEGITRVGDECVGVTFGDFAFHERLAEVTERIREQNEAVDDSGDPYVTVAHIAELSIEDPEDPSLAGGQGELLGLAYQQREHNRHRSSSHPRIKILIGNAGEGWAHSLVAAEEIVSRADDESLGMDRPIAAVGFGHSVIPNSRAIQKVGEASITVVGTTATFDDVAQHGAREHSEFFFPVAPANSRIAEQSAHWARNGVSWTGPDSEELGLPEHRTAVAIASAETDADGAEHEQYGPHLAREFIAAFMERGGEVWSGAQDLSANEYDDRGVLLYQGGDLDTDTTYAEQLRRLCTDDDPPDLLYYAGRSDDFTEFYRRFTRTGGGDCAGGGMTIFGGDDISKFVSDEEVLIERNAEHHPVFYTPLAPSGPWGTQSGPEDDAGASDQGFYEDIEELVRELYEEEDEDGETSLPPKVDLPSIAHAAVGSDALLVLSDAMPATGLSQEELDASGPLGLIGLDQPPFLRTQEQYEAKRDELHGEVKTIEYLNGVSGYIEFDAANDGNWYDGRMVQLVLVGPRLRNAETGETQRQHVVQRCGMRDADTAEQGAQCLPVGPETER